ncbi:MAG TPA: hypothetical protein VMZ26_11160 [Pyrinomonadaceae bacterium]|nr:hypothetical protein [Pyrinomonadaceae bacterium]
MKVFIIACVALLIFSVASAASAQRRDYMTDAEIELVRDNQDIDKRVQVLTRMIDRRFTALGVEVGGWKQSGKDEKLWGEAPAGTPSNLLADIRHLLQKAVDDVDDVAEHNENTLTQNKTEGLLFPAGVRSLATAAARYQPALKSLLDKTKDDRDKGVILTSMELCQEIIDSVTKLPAETKEEEKKRTKEEEKNKKKGKT